MELVEFYFADVLNTFSIPFSGLFSTTFIHFRSPYLFRAILNTYFRIFSFSSYDKQVDFFSAPWQP